VRHTEDRACKLLGCLKTYFLTHPQAYKLGDKTIIIMKHYDKTFICTLPVNQLAEQLLNSYGIDLVDGFIHEEIFAINYGDTDLISDSVSPDVEKEIKLQCNEYVRKYEYIEKIVESIIDSIVDNGQACSNLFNTLNGWEQKPVPEMSKKRAEEVQEEAVAEEIAECEDEHLQSELDNTRNKIYKIEEYGEMSFKIEQELDDLQDYEKLLSGELNSRHNH
jgi:hypothetical protein